MKNTKLHFIILISLVIFSSCSSDENGSNDDSPNMSNIKPSSYTVTEFDGDTWTVNLEYSGNLISKVTTDFGRTIIYSYDGSRLVSFISSGNGESITTNFIYENNRLIETRTDDEMDIYKFYYNNSGQINKVNWIAAGNDNISFFQYDSRGNVIEKDNGITIFKTTYDNKNNPFKNVTPQFDAGIGYPWYGSLINNEIEVQTKLSNESTFSRKYTYEYMYNENDFPIQRKQIMNDGRIGSTVNYTY